MSPMSGSHSRELSDSETKEESDKQETLEEHQPKRTPDQNQPQTVTPTSSIDDVDEQLGSLKLKYSNPSPNPNTRNPVKLYFYDCGNSPNAHWIISDKLTSYSFLKSSRSPDGDDEDGAGPWVFKVGSKVRTEVGLRCQVKPYPDQRRVDFIANGVWAVKFSTPEAFRRFLSEYQDCLFENTYGIEASEENRIKVSGNDFMGWARPESADDSIWDRENAAEQSVDRNPAAATPTRASQDLMEEFEEAASEGGIQSLALVALNPAAAAAGTPTRASQDLMEEFEEAASEGGIQSLALGALENSFLVSDSGVQVVKNFSRGIHGKGLSVRFANGNPGSAGGGHSAPQKALLMRGETNMLLMRPAADKGKLHSTGVHQLDIETGKVVTEWKFDKDGTNITMRDITNDSKGAQLDPSESTFLGLDNIRLCRWDMRDRRGMVQNLANSAESPVSVLQWTQGHQFSRGTNFQCFATTGDGSIVVGSLDGKIRLYSNSSMRMAKTAFPGLGSPITHVDVTFDGKWILGTTDTYLILISTVFKDKDGKEKTGFSGRMGNRIAAPRLMKLTPVDSHLAGANNKFRGGQFSWVTENGKQERHLVATVGKFSITWNFQLVKNSNHECYLNQEGLKSCYCYKIVLKDESIVDSRFMHEKFAASNSPEAPLVVATPMKVISFSISNR